MLVMDPHRVCLWCLEKNHNSTLCSDCQTMVSKALRERSLKLLAARQPSLVAPLRGGHGPTVGGGRGTAPRAPSPLPRIQGHLIIQSDPAQIKEFYKAMHLIFEQAVPSGGSLGPAGSAGAPLGLTSAALASGSGLAPVLQSRPPPAPGLTSPLPPPAPTGGSPILIPDDPELERRRTTPTPTAPIRPRSLSEHYLEQPGTGEEWEGSEDPLEYDLEQYWYEDLGEASGLDTSPDTGMLSPLNVATEEGASYAMVVCRAAEVLDLDLLKVPVRTNLLTEVIQPGVDNIRADVAFQ
ncbi:hypothetical protein NDU88_005940 [Pleurodeles waltl]|uniref:Uncharacterized protein n=1 Tax=Pleurodeles waltl TaxID=8319 RepID=A0AAV7WWP8_PLEWA|nr:hypothetical protein NDU88_005940 [Pleurodeles waltl]